MSCTQQSAKLNSGELNEKGNKLKQEEKTSKPNVLFIAVDDLRPEINSFGASQIISPNLDKLAKKSLVFNRAYCNIPTCGASRTSLLTGTRPTRHRFLTYDTRKDKEMPDVVSLIMQFKREFRIVTEAFTAVV